MWNVNGQNWLRAMSSGKLWCYWYQFGFLVPENYLIGPRIRHDSPSDTVSHPSRLESLATPLLRPQIKQSLTSIRNIKVNYFFSSCSEEDFLMEVTHMLNIVNLLSCLDVPMKYYFTLP